jgi:hypothetical protein
MIDANRHSLADNSRGVGEFDFNVVAWHMIMSVIKSCLRHKIPVKDYLADILPGLANAPPQLIGQLISPDGALRSLPRIKYHH